MLHVLSSMLLTANIYALEPTSLYSNEDIDKLAKDFAIQINYANNVVRIPLVTEYMSELKNKLHADNVNFFIVESYEINAFAGPGGYIGINTALILSADSIDEFAAVLAHEISHVKLHHLYYWLEHQKRMKVPMLASVLAGIALGLINPNLASGAFIGSMSGIAQNNINFIRANEIDADKLGVKILEQSGYSPQGMLNFFKKMQDYAKYSYNNMPAMLKTHPQDMERMEAVIRNSKKLTTIKQDNGDFYMFREYIRSLGNKSYEDTKNYYQKTCPNATYCRYGQALNDIKYHKKNSAKIALEELLKNSPNNIWLNVSLSSIAPNPNLAILYKQNEQNYALTMAYANMLLAENNLDEAFTILLKSRQIFRNDLRVCELFAQVANENNKKAQAYFTLGQCAILKDDYKDALQKLNLAAKLNKNDKYLTARIDASIIETKNALNLDKKHE
jgi:beta-barrel assembly-enhancing protease